MATFERENEDKKGNKLSPCKFAVPDKITVKQQLEYFSAAGGMIGNEYWLRTWQAAKTLVQDWECEIMPDIDTDLDTVTDPQVSHVVIWAGIQVASHIDSLQVISKNS